MKATKVIAEDSAIRSKISTILNLPVAEWTWRKWDKEVENETKMNCNKIAFLLINEWNITVDNNRMTPMFGKGPKLKIADTDDKPIKL